MPYRSFNDPKHWRERAEEARAHAQQMTDPEAKRMMLAIAEDYEKLARRAQERFGVGAKERAADLRRCADKLRQLSGPVPSLILGDV